MFYLVIAVVIAVSVGAYHFGRNYLTAAKGKGK